MPTGLFNSPKPPDVPATPQIGPRRAINQSFQMIFVAANVPQRFQFANVPLGCSVALRGDNGTGSNAGNVYVGEQPNQLAQGPSGRQTITPDTEITYPVDNLGQIWAMGAVGDGVIAYIRGSALP